MSVCSSESFGTTAYRRQLPHPDFRLPVVGMNLNLTEADRAAEEGQSQLVASERTF
jgi:hypothetical protein